MERLRLVSVVTLVLCCLAGCLDDHELGDQCATDDDCLGDRVCVAEQCRASAPDIELSLAPDWAPSNGDTQLELSGMDNVEDTDSIEVFVDGLAVNVTYASGIGRFTPPAHAVGTATVNAVINGQEVFTGELRYHASTIDFSDVDKIADRFDFVGLGDFDQDGNDELVSEHYAPQAGQFRVEVYKRRQGAPGYYLWTTLDLPHEGATVTTKPIAVVDLNGDERVDILMDTGYALTNAQGLPTQLVVKEDWSFQQVSGVSDLDGDGRIEIRDSRADSVWEFDAATGERTPYVPFDLFDREIIATGDMDGDGVEDFAIAHADIGDGLIGVYFGPDWDRTGTIILPADLAWKEFTAFADDIDDDGASEIVLATRDGYLGVADPATETAETLQRLCNGSNAWFFHYSHFASTLADTHEYGLRNCGDRYLFRFRDGEMIVDPPLPSHVWPKMIVDADGEQPLDVLTLTDTIAYDYGRRDLTRWPLTSPGSQIRKLIRITRPEGTGVAALADGELRLFWADNSGGLAAGDSAAVPNDAWGWNVEACDLNRDGYEDISVSLSRSQDNQTFTQTIVFFTTDEGLRRFDIDELTGAGRILVGEFDQTPGCDLVTMDAQRSDDPGRNHQLWSTSTAFSLSAQNITLSGGSELYGPKFYTADLTGDGHSEILHVARSGQLRVLAADPANDYPELASWSPNTAANISYGELNQVGSAHVMTLVLKDVQGIPRVQPLRISRNLAFTTGEAVVMPDAQVTLGDVDGDGSADYGMLAGAEARLLLTRPDARTHLLPQSWQITVGDGQLHQLYTRSVFVDLNQDGLPEWLHTVPGQWNTVHILRNASE